MKIIHEKKDLKDIFTFLKTNFLIINNPKEITTGIADIPIILPRKCPIIFPVLYHSEYFISFPDNCISIPASINSFVRNILIPIMIKYEIIIKPMFTFLLLNRLNILLLIFELLICSSPNQLNIIVYFLPSHLYNKY